MVILSKAKNLSEEKFLLGQDPTYNAVVLDFRVVDFLDSSLRLCLSSSVENLLLTSSLALLDSTLPKIRQNDEE